ncbi:Conserved_hypothetical protein [Hexamita inflata]|uniref:Uncharacterized protein n=1 Tax=Hexamita inflata TaxID=28002 RepID=A0AA86NP19_9EUKA|nr:Conserved hypothetical protein [Hexamita inflata]
MRKFNSVSSTPASKQIPAPCRATANQKYYSGSLGCQSLITIYKMFSSIIVVYKYLQQRNQQCSSNILVDNMQHSYCQKLNTLNNVKLNDAVYLTQKANNINLFIYTNATQQSQINVSVSNVDVNVFSLFGFGTHKQTVTDSNINISLQFQVQIGALICTICGVEVQSCNLTFVASGRKISSVIITPKDRFTIQSTFVQFRIKSHNSSGLANVLSYTTVPFEICNCKMTGVNLIQSQNNGYIASTVHANVFLQISQFDICVDSTPRFGYESAKITVTGIESVRCDVCDSQSVVYGLCRDSLTYSELVGGMYQCVPPFEYADNKCVCAYGYLLNDTQCVNVVDAINDVQDLVNDTNADQMEFLEQNLESVQNFLIQIDQSIASNFTDIDSRIISNYTLANQNLFLNTSVLDARIFANISDIKHDFYISQIKADTNLLANTTVLDQRIFKNVSILNNTIYNLTLLQKYINNSLYQQNEIIEQQKNIVNNLASQLNCTNNQGSLVNGTCVQVSCSIQGQKVQNGQCTCSTIGAFVQNGACSCGEGSLNISNLCKCPDHSSLVNGVCTCDQIFGQLMIDGICKCPTGQSVENGICIYLNYVINNTEFEQVCSQEVYTQIFDIDTKTTSFTNYLIYSSKYYINGYVFGTSSNIINNAFIDVCDNVYSNNFSLFQSQYSFTNIKLQIGEQNVYNCTLISQLSRQITMNQINIISRPDSELSVHQKAQIITQQSTNVKIINLLINISFTLQNGNISLVNNISGVFNIQGYQVLGTYVSTGTVSMIGINIDSAIVNVNNVAFQPSSFFVGNYSSYLFAISTYSTIQVNSIAIILGNQQNTQILTSIQTYEGAVNEYRVLFYYQFGGIVSIMKNQSTLNIYDIIVDSYQTVNTIYTRNFGIIVGYVISHENNIVINNICLQQIISIKQQYSSNSIFEMCGLIGQNQGNLQIRNSYVIQKINGYTRYSCLGVIGQQAHFSIDLVVVNLKSSLSLNSSSSSGNSIGSIFGKMEKALNCSIKNTTVQGYINSSGLENIGGFIGSLYYNNLNITIQYSNMTQLNISGWKNIGGYIGFQYQKTNITIIESVNLNSILSGQSIGGFIGVQDYYANTTIQNSSINNTNISSKGQAGGILGYCSSTLYLMNLKIQFVRFSTDHYGVVSGSNRGTLIIVNSSSIQNYYNGLLITDCPLLQNIWSYSGC